MEAEEMAITLPEKRVVILNGDENLIYERSAPRVNGRMASDKRFLPRFEV
jgi:hypothetical protein